MAPLFMGSLFDLSCLASLCLEVVCFAAAPLVVGGIYVRCVCVYVVLVVVGSPFLWEPSGPRPEPLNVRSSRPQPTPELQACT